jgi:hypothetical protein
MAEKRTIELEIQDNSKTLKQQYKEAVVELQKVSAAYGETSDEAVAAAKAAAELKDQIGFTNDLINSFNPDAKFDALSKSFGGVLDGFSAVQGAMGLVGVESAAVEETMLKVQSAMALSQGFQGLMEAKDSFKQLGTVAKDTFKSLSSESSLAGKATSALGPVWKAVGLSGKTALSGIRAGIAATGIGLLVVALGAVVAYWDDIKAAVGGVSGEMEKNLELSHQQVENAQSEVELFDLQENSLRLQGKSEEDILKIRQGKLKVLAKEEEKEIALAEKKKKLEVDAAKRNKGLLEGYLTMQIEGIILPFRILGGLVDATMLTINAGLRAVGADEIKYKTINSYLTEFREYAADGLSKMVFDPEGIAKESDAAIKAMKTGLEKTKSEIAGAELEIRDLKKGSTTSQAKDKKEADMSMTEYLNALEVERQAKITDAKEKELQELANKYDEMSALADKAGQDTTELTKKYQQDQIDITKKYNDLEKQAQAEKDAELLQKMREADMAAYEVEKNARQLRIDGMKEGRSKELEIIDLAYDSELLALNNQLDAKAISEEDYQKQKALMEEKYGKQIADTNKKFDDEDRARRQEAIQRNADFTKQGLSIISDITEMFGKKSEKQAKRAFAIKKAANIATALVDTYTSANAAYLSQFTPVPDPSSPVRGAVAAGLAIASGLVNVAKIATQKFEGGGSTGAGGSGGGGSIGGGMSGGTQAPSFNVVGNNGLNQLAQLQQQPTQAYVVSGQVTTAQSLDRNRIQNATL